jgi:ABC-type Fe3+/spermidine/putrescine transport system ATPase subunit
MPTTNIKLTSISKNYAKVTALKDISLEFPAGKASVIVGPSGCGKSTLLRLIAGFIQPDKGEIWFGDKLVTQLLPEKRPTSLVFQNYALFPHKTVFENIAFGLRVRHWKTSEIKGRVKEMLSLVALDGLEKRYPGELSGGQQQRVALARSLAISPDILLLDEPLSNLDAQTRGQMRMELKMWQQKLGITTLYVTHDQEEALSLADQLVVMQNGTVEQAATPFEVYTNPATPFVAEFIGRRNLLKGAISRLYEDKLEIALTSPEGTLHLVGLRQNWKQATPPFLGQIIWVGIKPEEIEIVNTGSEMVENKLNGKVLNQSFSGENYRLSLITAVGKLELVIGTLSLKALSHNYLSVVLPPEKLGFLVAH